MSFFFTDNIRQDLFATPAMFTNRAMSIVFFREAPVFENNDPRYTGVTTLADLTAKKGWVQTGATVTFTTVTTKIDTGGDNNYVRFARVPFTALTEPVEVKAMALLTTSPAEIVFVTSTPFLTKALIYPQDGLTSNPDIATIFEVPPPESNNRWLFSWATAPTGATTVTSVVEGPLAISQGAPPFEASHTQHAWLYPQRANMVANPSFESAAVATSFWSTNGAAARVNLPTPSAAAGAKMGRFTKGSPPLVVESNVFPTYRVEQWTVQVRARGNGNLKVGFVWWDDDFTATVVDWGVETWTLNPSSFTHIAICRSAVETYQGMLRLETDGTELEIDQVLVEKGFLKDWDYFDGDSDYGERGDYSWYGGATRKGGSYSLWYNNYKAVFGRLFNRETDDISKITDEDLEEYGYVYKWIPAGTVVIPHSGVLHAGDTVPPVIAKAPTDVLSYRATETDMMGIVNPWT